MKGHKISFESTNIIKIPSTIAKKLYRKKGRVVFSVGENGCQLEDDRDLALMELCEKIDEIPSGYENLSEEEIEKVCAEAIASVRKNRKENCKAAFGVN